MKKCSVLGLGIMVAILFVAAGDSHAGETPCIQVAIKDPAGPLKMGARPVFKGVVKNTGPRNLEGLVVYLSLVDLKPGHEHPVDLEDWSAQKAVRVDQLAPGRIHTQDWPMRLIQAGRFGVALTVVDPREKRPIVSDLVPFEIQPKPTVVSGRIFPVAIGEPLLLLALLGLIHWIRSRSMGSKEAVHI
ncbi:MAG TPA: hypothetical protein VKA34_03470 [Balneolales bacterium]|nr:hypothetical protein [Balneolales bacterium]